MGHSQRKNGQQPKINPQTNEQVLTNGRPTYLEFQYTEDSNAHDMWIDNEEDEVEQEVQKVQRIKELKTKDINDW